MEHQVDDFDVSATPIDGVRPGKVIITMKCRYNNNNMVMMSTLIIIIY